MLVRFRNRVTMALVWVVLIALVRTTVADKPAQGSFKLKQEVARLIGELNSASRKQRVQAGKSLFEFGPKILPLLPAPELLRTPSVRETVRQLRIRLERKKAQQSIGASTVQLVGKHSVAHMLNHIQEQTKNDLDLQLLPAEFLSQQQSVQYEGVDFWKAVDQLCQQTNLTFRIPADASHLQFFKPTLPAKKKEQAVAYSRAFRVSVLEGQSRKLFGNAQQRKVRFRLGITSEPRLRPLFLQYAAKNIQVQTADGQYLKPFEPAAQYELPMGEGGRHVEIQADFLTDVDTELTKIDLQGKFVMQTAAGVEEISFTNLPQATGVARRKGGVTVKLRKVQFKLVEAKIYQAEIQASVSYDSGGPAFESHRTWIFHNHSFLLAKDGKRSPMAGGFETTLQADGAISVKYQFNRLAENPSTYRFVYLAPTLIINVPINFKLTGIPISKVVD